MGPGMAWEMDQLEEPGGERKSKDHSMRREDRNMSSQVYFFEDLLAES